MTSSVQCPMVYIIDDDDGVRDSLRVLLECEGVAVETYASCTAFLRAVRWEEHCCVVADVHMRGMGGVELLDQLRRDGITAAVILITGMPDPQIREAAARGGAAFLEKPFRADQLIDCIAQSLFLEEC